MAVLPAVLAPGCCCGRCSPSKAFDRGYRAESVLSMLVDPLGSKYPTDEALQQFYDQVEAEIAAVPGVAGVGWASDRPLDFFETGGVSFEIVGEPPLDGRERPSTEYQAVSPTYFSTLDLPILAGRAFDGRDTRDGVPVCIVNEAFATTFRRALADRPARRAAADVVAGSQAGRARDRRRRAAGEGTAGRGRGLRAALRADGAGHVRRHLSASSGRSPAPPRRWRRRCGPPSRAWTGSSSSACGAS